VRQRVIIMPPFMLRPRSFCLAVLLLGNSTAFVHAAEPICKPAPVIPEKGTDVAGEADDPPRDPDDQRVEISSDKAGMSTDGNAKLEGNVRVRQGAREIRANEVEYDSKDNAFKVTGGMEFRDPMLRAKGEGGTYSAENGANFNRAEFELVDRAARGSADALRMSPEGVIDLEGVTFTTCPITDPAWRLRADRITLDTRTQIGTGHDTRVEFKGVPILYMPWMSFPLGTERKSGFLFPSIGHTTRSGLQVAVPYYWNIAPNLDLTFEPFYYGRRGIDLAGDFRYLTENQRGAVQFNVLPDDQLMNDRRSRIHIEHVAELPNDFRLTIDAEDVSDSEYFEDFAQGPEGTSVAFVERLATLSYRDEHWRVAGEFQHFQTIDTELTEFERPYARVPRLVAGADYGWGPGGRVRYGFDSELVNFDRAEGVTGWRMDVAPTAELELGGPGLFVRPGVSLRHTQYKLEDNAPGTEESPSRTLPIASLDAGLQFERPSGSKGSRVITLEPRMLYLYAPFREQSELPLFDTALPDLNLVQLFRTNRYVGADRVSDANQVSMGVTSRMLDAGDGTQFLAATLGQTYYFETPRVTLPGEVARTSPRSDFVAQLALTAYKDWNVDLGLQWDPSEERTERAQARLQYKPGDEQVINVGYRLQRDSLEQAEVSSAWPIGQQWSAFGRFTYSIRDNSALERFAGFEYRACCWRLRFVGRRFVSSRTGEQDTGFYLQLELNGLASVGSAADAFLTDAIRGYSRTDSRGQIRE